MFQEILQRISVNSACSRPHRALAERSCEKQDIKRTRGASFERCTCNVLSKTSMGLATYKCCSMSPSTLSRQCNAHKSDLIEMMRPQLSPLPP